MRKLVVAAVWLLLAANAFAQTTNATLGGTAADATGALIPGVTVTATNTQTGIVTTVITNETGAYQFAALQTGIYKVSAELSGFQTQTYNDVNLGVGQQVDRRSERISGYPDRYHVGVRRRGAARVQSA
jgi:hypothetical protein